MELLARLIDSVRICRVDNENETLRARVVVSPQRSNLVLAADILFISSKIEPSLLNSK
jgi:hypothetical protein